MLRWHTAAQGPSREAAQDTVVRLHFPASMINLLNDSNFHTEGAQADCAKALQEIQSWGCIYIAVRGSEVQQLVCTAPTTGWVSKLLVAQTGCSGSPDVGHTLQR